jgi:hypothetical protein
MKIYKYENYDDYVNNQIEANHAKLKSVYVEKKTIKKSTEIKKRQREFCVMAQGMQPNKSILRNISERQKL